MNVRVGVICVSEVCGGEGEGEGEDVIHRCGRCGVLT